MTDFEPIHILQPERAGLGFRFEKPRSWHVLDLPAEEPQFDNPEFLLPLHVCMAPYGAVVHSVAVRPAYGDGAVSEWMIWLCGKQGIAIDARRSCTVGASPAVECQAQQDSEAGHMRMRILFLEDGRRLFTVTCMAPEEIWTSVEPIFEHMLASFQLDEVHGATAPLDHEPAPGPAEEETRTSASDVALAEDTDSLNPEHPMNARLRDNGVGLVPRVHAVNTEEKFAVVGAGALESLFHLPFGWHVVDDGRRTLIFDAAGRIQINLNLRMLPRDGIHGLMEAIEQEHEQQQPGIPHVHFHAAGFDCLAFRGMQVGEEVLDQTFLLRQASRDGMALTARVTAKEEDMAFAMNAAEVVLLSLRTPQ